MNPQVRSLLVFAWSLVLLQAPAAATPTVFSEQASAQLQQLPQDAGAPIARDDGVIVMRALFQDLEAEAGPDGLWLRSTADEDPGRSARFRVTASATSRSGPGSAVSTLAATGETRLDKGVATWARPGLLEEYMVGADGVRQDFVVAVRPSGTGDLTVMLAVAGARAEAAAYGAKLVPHGSGREIAYHRLCVTDAAGRELPAELEVCGPEAIRISVDDSAAVYPVRIDPTFCDCDWIGMGGTPGVDGSVFAITADASGNLYVGGSFSVAGGVAAANVAKWNGSSWNAMGDGIFGTVYSLAVAGSLVYAGGEIFGGVTCWNGHSWSPLREGVNGSVSALVASGGSLYVGGSFTTAGAIPANNIARWSGGNWSALGLGADGAVSELVGSGSDLYVGGSFNSAGGVSDTSRIAKWNGSAWSSVGGGMNGNVNAMTLHDGYLYAGGDFLLAGGVPAPGLARWNIGSGSWAAISVPSSLLVTYGAIAVYGGELYVAGSYQDGLGPVYSLAKWNLVSETWSFPPATPGNRVWCLTVAGGQMYVGGDFLRVGEAGEPEVGATGIACWNGTTWSALGGGFNLPVYAIASLGSDLYVGGGFHSTPSGGAQSIAKWDGNAWSALGSGTNGIVSALVAWNGSIYVGGEFTEAGGLTVNHIARWNPATSSWSGLQPPGLGTSAGTDGPVIALAASATRLYVGGSFDVAGGATTANAIAAWDGTSWTALGSGVVGHVTALAVSGGDLFVGGSFSSAGGVSGTLNIARWNGSAWNALGASGANGGVFALAVSGSDLYAGGSFTEINGVAASFVARWNGSVWSPLGPGTGGLVRALAVSGTGLYVGGFFTTVGAIGADRIAKWDSLTSEWSALGSGLDNVVRALAVANGRLFVGGDFKTAGRKFSPSLASTPLVTYSDGSLDAAFGSSGQVTTAIGGSDDRATSVVVQPDGRVVVAGFAFNPGAGGVNFGLARYTATGGLDPGFGSGGMVTTDFSGGEDRVTGVALQADGKIVVTGYVWNGSSFDFGVARYTTTGVLDTGFGSGGKVITDFAGQDDTAQGVKVQSDGMIVVAGTAKAAGAQDFALARYTSTGVLDPGFASGGKVTTDLGGANEDAMGLAIQADGKIVVVGDAGAGTSADFAIVRYGPSGMLDLGFGTAGIVATDFAGLEDLANAVAIQADGKIVVAGYAETADSVEFALARYTPGGALDPGFGTAGKTRTRFGANGTDEALGLALQTDGKIVAAGYAWIDTSAFFALARYSPDGTLDPCFGDHGTVTTAFGENYGFGRAIALQADGKLVVAGQASNGVSSTFALARYATGPNIAILGNDIAIADGDTLPDPADGTDMGAAPIGGGTSKSFSIRNTGRETLTLTGDPGTFVTVSPAAGPFSIMALSLIGSIPPCDGETSFAVVFNPTLSEHVGLQTATVTVRSNDPDEDPYTFTVRACGIATVFSDGRLDTTFDSDGKVTTSLGVASGDFVFDAAEQADGKIVVVGLTTRDGTNDFLVARYRSDGSLDPSFGSSGTVTTPVGTGSDGAEAVLIQPDGKIVVAGHTSSDPQSDFAVARYLPDGDLDTSFGSGGLLTIDFGGIDLAFALALQADGSILAAGVSLSGSDNDFALVRLTPTGVVDATLGGGAVTYDFAGGNDDVREILVQPDGMIVLAGSAGNDFGLLRIDPYGVPDPSFGSGGKVTTDFAGGFDRGFGAVLAGGGRILVVGESQGHIGLARYLSNGTPDPSFGSGGKTTAHNAGAYDVALQPDGKIVACGLTLDGGDGDFALARFEANGAPDLTFDSDGFMAVNLTAGLPDDSAQAVLIQCDGHIVLAGYSTTGLNTDIALTRHAVADRELEVFGNGIEIADGDTTPSATDHTDFGVTCTAGTGVARTFTLSNIGAGVLNLTGIPRVDISGATDDFIVTSLPGSSIAGGASDTFTITFVPTTTGLRTATVSIASDDSDENPYTFAIRGSGATAAEIFAAAMNAAGLAGPQAEPAATPFHDGVPNLVKYAFNMDLTGPDVRMLAAGGTAGLPRITLEGSGASRVLRFEFIRRTGCEIVYLPEKNTGLGPAGWVALGDEPVITPINSAWERAVYEEPAPTATTPRLFGRVQIEIP